jgi:preprotein translocase subunit YajC
MQTLYRKISLLIILTLPFSCKKLHTDAGIDTNVSGIVMDYKSQQPIKNIPIYIDEYETGFYGPKYRATIDSTKSGVDGKYKIHFSTTGQGIQYRIGFKPGGNFYILHDDVTLNVGKDTVVNFYATQYHILKARIEMTDNPNPPMRVSTIAGLQANVWSTNNDTLVFMKVIPNQKNEIQYTITNVDTPSVYNYKVDTINFPGFQDTISVTLPVIPKSFPKRG